VTSESRMIRVALVGPFPVDRELSNGVEAVTVGMATLLAARQDVELHVITAVFDGQSSSLAKDGFTLHTIGSSNRLRRLTFYTRERREIGKVITRIQPDVVHAQGANFYGRAAVSTSVPTVVTLHGMLAHEAKIVDPRSSRSQQAKTRIRGYFNTRFEQRVLDRAQHIITISEYVNVTVAGRTTAQLTAIANPIGQRFFDNPREPERGRLLCVARIEPRKGQHHLIEAVARLKEQGVIVSLRLVGKQADEGYTKSLRDLISAHGLVDDVVLTGVVSEDELFDEYRLAEVVVLASREETSPMAFQQAMAGGIAVVGPANAGIPYLIDHEVNGLLVSGTDLGAELAGAIKRILTEPGLADRLGEAGRATAYRRFSAAQIVDDTIELYRSMLD
jgi:glycosyltransferase involved in cell wall biosynthesis